MNVRPAIVNDTLNTPPPKSTGSYDSYRPFCVPCGIDTPSMSHSVRGRGFELMVALITASDPKTTPYTLMTGSG
ncbi:hypothetical protein Bhyg_16581 [Pseudolycoriella hygida]|uniref:Uncharacterized protein n=1 Tax=Pseudolycoriella hygida TaxID=35572 RepID=A0A9Q0MMW4_9DIPT|nr:hypothetical protein Bhyg_16581 [Pseudolycoriella hygida]